MTSVWECIISYAFGRWALLKGDSGLLDQEDFERRLDENTVFVAIASASNACGAINPVKEMIR